MADGDDKGQGESGADKGADDAAKAAAAAADKGAADAAAKAEADRVAALTPEQKAAEDKAAADKKAADDKAKAAPGEYDAKAFKAPEGMQLDEAALNNALPLFKEAKLDQATAQKFVDLYAAQVKAAGEAGAKAWEDVKAKWQGDLKTSLADSKEFTGAQYGGERLKEVQSLAAKAIDAYGGEDAPALREHMKLYALGDFGPMARFMARAGRTVTEDSSVRGADGAGAAPRLADNAYPSMKKE